MLEVQDLKEAKQEAVTILTGLESLVETAEALVDAEEKPSVESLKLYTLASQSLYRELGYDSSASMESLESSEQLTFAIEEGKKVIDSVKGVVDSLDGDIEKAEKSEKADKSEDKDDKTEDDKKSDDDKKADKKKEDKSKDDDKKSEDDDKDDDDDKAEDKKKEDKSED